MKRFESLKKNSEFQTVYSSGRSKVNRLLVMIVRENHTGRNRYGISVSKKVGNSVVRHRVTRVIREIIRLHQNSIEQGYDIVIVARSKASSGDYRKIESALCHLLNLHHLLSEDDRI